MSVPVKLRAIYCYPVKSCAALPLSSARLDAQGVEYDRRWMAVRADDGGHFLTQREHPQMALVRPAAASDGLTLDAPGMPTLRVPAAPDGALAPRVVRVWGFTGEARDEGDAAAAWFSDFFGFACRLVRTPDDFARRVNPRYARPDDRVGFADGYPVLLASLASLDDLNARLVERGGAPVPMARFRPNLVVSGAAAWAEDGWAGLRAPASGLAFRAAKPSDRCAVTTVDQATGAKAGPEPLATLARFRRDEDGKVYFGLNLCHEWDGEPRTLSVGDTLEAS